MNWMMGIAMALGLTLGCAQDKEAKEKPAPTPTPVAKPAPAKANPADAVKAVDAVMAPYEQCRALLAADKGDGVAACAEAMATAATANKGGVPAAAQPHMDAIAAAAGELAKAPAGDLEALRLAFGKVSEPTVALLTAVPEAAKKYHVFECPMAKGYKRWAQPTAELANPYMGTAMLTCGSEVHDHHGMH